MYLNRNDLLPWSFDDSFQCINQVHNFNTRNSNLYHLPFCRTKIRQFSFGDQSLKFFNTFSHEFRNAVTDASFQSKLKNCPIFCS